MSKYILSPCYCDNKTVVLGLSVSKIIKSFKKHWQDELEDPNSYNKEHILAINRFFKQKFSSAEEIESFYIQNFDEDYRIEQIY